MSPESSVYGLMAEFDSAEALLSASRAVRSAGYRWVEAFTPFPIEGLDEVFDVRDHRVALITLIGGVVGCFGGFGMQEYAAVFNYPFNVGGRPLNSWPTFIPVTFELTILCAALAAFVGLLWLNGFPRPHHPVFNATRFNLATFDRFFLCVKAIDPRFDPAVVRDLLERQHPQGVFDVPL